MIRLRMLGTVDLKDSQDREVQAVLRRPKLLALLGYLAAARPAGFHRRDTLVALLWPEDDNAHARNSLRQAVHALRAALGREAVTARGEEELGLGEQALSCDVCEFAAALEAGAAERALELYRGGFLEGVHVSEAPEFERWVDQEREHLRRRATEAAQTLAERAADEGNPVGASRWALRVTELSPYDETAVRRLIELLDRSGDRAGAVRAYEEFERRLQRDLEVQPSPSTRRFVDGIRADRQVEGTAAPTDGGKEQAEALQLGRSSGRAPRGVAPTRTRVAVVLALLVGALLASGWLLSRARASAARAEAARRPKRLVVLPFANLGPAADAYFADGISEEIAARLATIDHLRVISRTSATLYKSTNKTMAQIAAELGVDYVLEGSVRWEKSPVGQNRVRVTPRLVNTANETDLWAQVYDEPLDEIFRVQSDIAEKVVQSLEITLRDPQRHAVRAAPTGDLKAYDYYLRGNDLQRLNTEERGTRAAVRMYEKAVELDPAFALAYAQLSRMHSRMYWYHYDHSRDRLARAKRAVDRAFELAPDLPEAHHSLGAYYFMGELDYDRALREFAIAAASRPNDSELFLATAAVLARQGRLRDALASYETALQLDPRSALVANTYAQTYDRLRDFAHAESLYDRAIALSPDWAFPYFFKAGLYLRRDGSTREARAVLEEARTVGVADNPLVLLEEVTVDIFDRHYDAARNRLSSTTPEVIADQFRFIPRAQLYAQVYGLMQRHDLERAYYDSARSFVSSRLQQMAGDSRLHSALGIAYAGLGRKLDAVREGERGVALLPVSKEAYRGYYREWDLARIYAMVDERQAALDRLDHLLSIPGNLTVAWLRVDPTWDALRGDSGFQRLLNRRR